MSLLTSKNSTRNTEAIPDPKYFPHLQEITPVHIAILCVCMSHKNVKCYSVEGKRLVFLTFPSQNVSSPKGSYSEFSRISMRLWLIVVCGIMCCIGRFPVDWAVLSLISERSRQCNGAGVAAQFFSSFALRLDIGHDFLQTRLRLGGRSIESG